MSDILVTMLKPAQITTGNNKVLQSSKNLAEFHSMSISDLTNLRDNACGDYKATIHALATYLDGRTVSLRNDFETKTSNANITIGDYQIATGAIPSPYSGSSLTTNAANLSRWDTTVSQMPK